MSIPKPFWFLHGRRSEPALAAAATDVDAARRIADPHSCPAAQILAALEVPAEAGLDDSDVRARQAAFGRNVLDTRPPKPASTILLHQFRSSVVALLAAAAALAAAFGDWHEATAILVVLILNTLLGFFTEFKAERSMAALRTIGIQLQRVRRGGQVSMVNCEDLVPGDIVLLEAGDVATADARVVAAANLSVDESVLTGESVPVEKSTDAVPQDAAIGDRTSMLYKGTAVTRGCAVGVVTATGMRTELGRVAHLASSAAPAESPLTRHLARLSTHLVIVTLVIAAAVATVGILYGHNLMLMLEAAIALAVAAIPEGLPIVATLVLARGMWRMASQNALIERLSAVETLGATTVIFADKTGTLTENRMTARQLATAAGDITFDGQHAGTTAPLPAVAIRLLEAAALCNDAILGAGGQSDNGDPLEIALLRAARDAGIERIELLRRHPEVAREPFDSDTRLMATVHRSGSGFLTAVKGAPEAVLARACRFAAPSGDIGLDESRRAHWRGRVAELASQGLRVLAIAERMDRARGDEAYRDLTFLGLVGLYDPPRSDVPGAIAACQRAGIRVIMVTGDHAVTAASIARSVSLGDEPRVIEGRALAEAGELGSSDADRAHVFARVSPSQKLDLVLRYQAAGEVVAMTGDGVNDAPALKQADIGVAMGRRGSEVARQAAAMVLRDDSFATIVAAIREGRVIFANIRRFIMYLLACNLSEVMVVGIAVAAGWPLPLLPLQILFLNLVTDVFPAFALAMGEGSDDVMARPPRDPAEPIVSGPQWMEIAGYGFVMTIAALAAMMLARDVLQLDGGAVVTVSFLTLAFAQIWHVFNMVEPGRSISRNEVTRNPYVWAAIAVSIGLIAAACYLPPLAGVLKIVPPDGQAWAIVLVASLFGAVVGRVVTAGLGKLFPVPHRRRIA